MKRITILLVLLFVSQLTRAQAGYLDETFGDGGVVTIKLEAGARITPDDIHTLPDGKIIHVGAVTYFPYNEEYLYMMRHHADGRIDPSFGTNGRIVYNFRHAGVTKLHCYPDGRLLAYGLIWDSLFRDRTPSVIRFLADGRVDSTFGNNGIYESPGSAAGDYFSEIKVDAAGTIFAFGARHKVGSSPGIHSPSITKITSSGKGDSLFGEMGVKIAGSEVDTGNVILTALMYGQDKCIFSVYMDDSLTSALTMFCTDFVGTIDSSFGINGRIIINISDGNEHIQKIIATPERKILCTAGLENDIKMVRSVLLRFLPTGELDHSFGDFGSASIPNDGYTRYNIAFILDSNKNIMQWGQMQDSDNSYSPITMHYLPDGQIDTTRAKYGTSKELIKHMAIINSVANDHDGKFVVAGYRSGSGNSKYTILSRINNIEKKRVVTASKNSLLLSIHPTPSTDNCTVTYTLPASGECTMSLRDESGREVRTFATSEYRTSGKHEEELDLRGLAAGVYFLQIQSGDKVQTAKLIKQ